MRGSSRLIFHLGIFLFFCYARRGPATHAPPGLDAWVGGYCPPARPQAQMAGLLLVFLEGGYTCPDGRPPSGGLGWMAGAGAPVESGRTVVVQAGGAQRDIPLHREGLCLS